MSSLSACTEATRDTPISGASLCNKNTRNLEKENKLEICAFSCLENGLTHFNKKNL